MHLLPYMALVNVVAMSATAVIYIIAYSYPNIFQFPKQLPIHSIAVDDSDKFYPGTCMYQKKLISRQNDWNRSYFFYNIKIGEIFMCLNSTTNISNLIRSNLIRTRKRLIKSNPTNVVNHQIYVYYYLSINTNNQSSCINNSQDFDFFNFIQPNTKTTNNLMINFYDLLPIEHIYGSKHTTYYAQLPSDYQLSNNNKYFVPTLFSYTISVKNSGDLASLQFRFAEVTIDAVQQYKVKHLVLNGVRENLLWAGECYYIFDHKYNKYILIMDNASGHWKPNITEIPYYLQDIMIQTLFPNYVNTTNGYKPIIFIGYKDIPWNRIKKKMFPIIRHTKKDALKQRKLTRKTNK
eukprot:503390_1